METGEARRAAFIDRDGVINAELNYVHRIEDFHILPGVFDALAALRDAGYAIVVVTNQAGIAKGKYTEAQFQRLTSHMLDLFNDRQIQVERVYHCPHHPEGTVAEYAVDCHCRKPGPGMIEQAVRDLNLRVDRSVLIGDKISDTDAGRAAGVATNILVESGHALPADANEHADHRAKDLHEAVNWFLERQ
ncbi:D-glycero-beta-D-manno-heptose 1,7-bisphosphate 7-phosphatase [Paraburkholderia acidisoli]|uniref:D,D-heptose 1,7-bisphosphate phosphatase n=1 Tax=Paraburkholderia acidisoli TaxID=2571748 RepID=A0A7Z2GFT1_9BURK|nr:D-glycero-beta-D-manno-heptose 1,7-bisphosphate 7-phosphatase [Paraburkholderia acidisoli]QGZ60704.1 D-glycero-beta-D-manno-heptose 1,7-bisphosphate 7-phosphatase [Paraburkholderia acidisoli]